MAKAIILVADDNPSHLEDAQERLEEAGFQVQPAGTESEARRILQRGDVDLAVLDMRLRNNRDEHDFSGLDIAKEVAPGIPKIIFTEFPSTETTREALRQQRAGLSPAVDFVDKKEDGLEALVTAVRRALRYESAFREMAGGLAKEIKKDYEDARSQARMNFVVALNVAVTGIVIILLGAFLAIGGVVKTGSLSIIGGVVTEAVGYLFFRRVDAANERMDRYHKELLEIRWLENLLAACEEAFEGEEGVVASKAKVIAAVTARWFPGLGEAGDSGDGE